MHLPNRDTVDLCVHLLQSEQDKLLKDSAGNKNEELIVRIKRAMDDLIRYDATVVLLRSSFQDLEGD
jgi:hypothetical protein